MVWVEIIILILLIRFNIRSQRMLRKLSFTLPEIGKDLLVDVEVMEALMIVLEPIRFLFVIIILMNFQMELMIVI